MKAIFNTRNIKNNFKLSLEKGKRNSKNVSGLIAGLKFHQLHLFTIKMFLK